MNLALALLALVAQDEQEPTKVTIAVLKLNLVADKGKFVVKTADKEIPIEAEKEAAVFVDHFTAALAKTGKFAVLEREKLDKLLREHAMDDSGLTDPSKSKDAGKLLGAQYLCQGSLTMLGGTVVEKPVPNSEEFLTRTTEAILTVDMRIVECETSKVVLSASSKEIAGRRKILQRTSKLALDADVNDLLAEVEHTAVKTIVRKLVDASFPIKVVSSKDGHVYVNRGKDALKVGSKLRVVTQGEELRDPDTNTVIGHEETELATIEVVEVQAKLSKAKVLKEGVEIPKGAICRLIEAPKPTNTKPTRKTRLGD